MGSWGLTPPFSSRPVLDAAYILRASVPNPQKGVMVELVLTKGELLVVEGEGGPQSERDVMPVTTCWDWGSY